MRATPELTRRRDPDAQQETWLIHMLVRLQDTQEATASFARPADLRLLPRTVGNARMIKAWQRHEARHFAGL